MSPAISRLRTIAAGTLASAIVGFSLAALLAAQRTPATPQQPTYKAGVNFVRVDVYPSANGRIVPDLQQADFEVLEDGVPQRVEMFERVLVRAPGSEPARAEPSTVRESNTAAATRSRLFVLFLDSYHTSVDSTTITAGGGVGDTTATGSSQSRVGATISRHDSRIGQALVAFLDRLIGPDDLVALFRPEEPIDSLTFTRRPASFVDLLLNGAAWQRRFVTGDFDAREQMYRSCYGADSPIAAQMIARRREKMVLDALRGLVRHLGAIREERKAVLVVTEGWPIFRPDASLRSAASGGVPGPPPIGVAGGRPALGDASVGNARPDCDRDRMLLADEDDERDFREMLDEANRANASFYPIDPRGLPAFDTPIGQPAAPAADARALRAGLESLQTLAGATDGIAIVNSNDLAANLARIADDLSSYYLLGYNSTNVKHDGKFRKITVRVKRPGVVVRARRGYLAPTEEEVRAIEAARAESDPASRGLESALDALDFARPGQTLRLRGGYAWPIAPSPRAAAQTLPGAAAVLSVVVELDSTAAKGPGWVEGGQLSASVLDLDGRVLASASGTVSPSRRTCLIRFSDTPLPPADYLVSVKARWSVLTTTEKVRVKVPDLSEAGGVLLGQPVLFRRSPYAGPGYQPTADLRFRRAERLRLDVPLTGRVDSVNARLLDRRGQPLSVPVAASVHEDAPFPFLTAEVALAPLAAADYVIEVSARRGEKADTSLTAIRLVAQ